MAAILGHPGSKRSKRGSPPMYVNHHVEDGGKRYRVCTTSAGRVLMVMLKCPTGSERALEPDGRRARQVIRRTGLT